MATKQRKNKRLKERLRVGDDAIAHLVQLQTQVASALAEIDRLQKTDATYKELVEQHREVSRELVVVTEQRENAQGRISALVADKTELRQQCDALHATVKRLQKENAKLRAEDRDSAKLRRRLRETKEKLNARNTEVSQLKKKLAGF